jgi:Domain of unknown function (DUF4276)
MVAIRIYVEGGGDNRATLARCRSGFTELFKKVLPAGKLPKVIACGPRTAAFSDFKSALADYKDEFIVLLVDAEAPVADGLGVWAHLKKRDSWDQPTGATDEQAHLMVQCMEAWFLTDRDTLKRYYGQGFRENALPDRKDVEKVAKVDLFKALKAATKEAKTKDGYDDDTKVSHGFDLLGRIDPARVRAASPHADQLMLVLSQRAGK